VEKRAISGRAVDIAIEPAATHGSAEHFVSSHAVIIPWIAAVVSQRPAPGSTRLRPLTDGSGWLGNNHTTEVAAYGMFAGPKQETSWLP
jgi:hypothetical protein